MARISRFILLDAPQDEVFDLVADYRTLAQIQPHFKTVRPTSEHERGLGATVELEGTLHGMPIHSTMKIVQFEPPILLVSESTGTVNSHSTWRFSTVQAADGSERTRAALALEYHFASRALELLGGLVGREVEHMTEQSLRLLKKLVEG